MHILLTRPIEDCENLIVRFRNLGHTVSHLPLIKVKKKNIILLIFLNIVVLFLQVQML